ncbi:hypothetical protein D3C73_1186050 [compost metagenome]
MHAGIYGEPRKISLFLRLILRPERIRYLIDMGAARRYEQRNGQNIGNALALQLIDTVLDGTAFDQLQKRNRHGKLFPQR